VGVVGAPSWVRLLVSRYCSAEVSLDAAWVFCCRAGGEVRGSGTRKVEKGWDGGVEMSRLDGVMIWGQLKGVVRMLVG